ncbi:MFS transporter [Actinoplanes aureus]|uniref:MFS transporter n=1 Tax=Actinoplanes aureus TaxID=2792083 RepID=UPI0028153818|nr:MFS transporter [Actinoplanes aureus]
MPRRYLILAICCLSLLIISLDATIVNIALPAIREDLDASVAGLQWTLDAYTLVLASLLVLAGSVADRIGRRRVFQAGLALSLGSLLCSLARSGWPGASSRSPGPSIRAASTRVARCWSSPCSPRSRTGSSNSGCSAASRSAAPR